jgi:anti-anti-sigma factor
VGEDKVVVLRGEYSHENSGDLRRQLNEAVMLSQGRRVCVDLAEVTFMDSLALGALISGYKRARAGGGELVVANCSPFVHEMLSVSGLLRVFMPMDQANAVGPHD